LGSVDVFISVLIGLSIGKELPGCFSKYTLCFFSALLNNMKKETYNRMLNIQRIGKYNIFKYDIYELLVLNGTQRLPVCGCCRELRGGACFCTRGAMQGYDVDLFIVALAKTVTPGGSPRREPGQAAPPTT
jgi:hypothetical protein